MKTLFVVCVGAQFLRDTQIFNPSEEKVPVLDLEDEITCEEYDSSDESWNDCRLDGYLGVYFWNEEDKEGLLSYVAKRRGFRKEILEAYDVMPDEASKSSFEFSDDNDSVILKVDENHGVQDVTYDFVCDDETANDLQNFIEKEYNLAGAAPHLVRNIIDYVFAQGEDTEITVALLAQLLDGTGVEENDILCKLRERSNA